MKLSICEKLLTRRTKLAVKKTNCSLNKFFSQFVQAVPIGG